MGFDYLNVMLRQIVGEVEMQKIKTYTATDKRIYNGCPCSDMKHQWDHTKMLVNRMEKADPTASCTYFPIEGKYLIFTNSNILKNPNLTGPPEVLTNVFHKNKQDALIEAIEILEKRSQ